MCISAPLILFSVSLVLRFFYERTQVINAKAMLWYERFIDYHPRITLTNDVLKDITKGLELGKLLNLPKGLSFDFQHMTDLVVSANCIRPFKHLL